MASFKNSIGFVVKKGSQFIKAMPTLFITTAKSTPHSIIG
jgi:hypothetical protein